MGGHRVFVTGATGYMGSRLIPLLIDQGHIVQALVRPASQSKAPRGCEIVLGNALDSQSYAGKLRGADTFVHLVGVSHPSPAKAQQFLDIDLKSLEEAVAASVQNSIRHFVYVSVAQPAPVMHAYVEARGKAEETLRQSGLNCSILRPWYVLGPGHRWPYALVPFYGIAELIPSMRDGARRLGLVTLNDMLATLAAAVADSAYGTRVIEVPEIRGYGQAEGKLLVRN